MCTGIVTNNGGHLRSVGEVEKHFGVNLDKYRADHNDHLERELCLCQIDLGAFMDEEPRKSQFYYENGEYWEND